MDYRSRFLSTQIARFTQPDTIVPNLYDPQSLNRYSYMKNNPLRYTDPSGHYVAMEDGDYDFDPEWDEDDYCKNHPNAYGCGGGSDDPGDGGSNSSSSGGTDSVNDDLNLDECDTYPMLCDPEDRPGWQRPYTNIWTNVGKAWDIFRNPNSTYGQ